MKTDVPDFSAGSYNVSDDASLPRSLRALSPDCLVLRQQWIDICRQFLTEWSTHKMPSLWKPGVRWDGGKDTSGRTYGPLWPKLLKLLDDNSFHHRSYIIAQFQANRVTRREPFPNSVIGENGIRAYREHCEGQAAKCRQEIELQTQVMDMALYERHVVGQETTAALQSILYDENLALSALFRYCAAVRLQLADVCSTWRKPALVQYLMCADAYDRDWEECIPPEFQEISRNTRPPVAGKVGGHRG